MKHFPIKLLIYCVLMVSVLPLTFFVNYAMVYHIKAAALSWLAVGGSIASILLHLRQPKGMQGKKWLITAFAFIFFYSLHIVGLVIFILLHRFREKLSEVVYGTKMSEEPPISMERISSIAPEIILLSLGYLLVDTFREYTVWHTFSLRALPLSSFGLIVVTLGVIRLMADRKN